MRRFGSSPGRSELRGCRVRDGSWRREACTAPRVSEFVVATGCNTVCSFTYRYRCKLVWWTNSLLRMPADACGPALRAANTGRPFRTTSKLRKAVSKPRYLFRSSGWHVLSRRICLVRYCRRLPNQIDLGAAATWRTTITGDFREEELPASIMVSAFLIGFRVPVTRRCARGRWCIG